METAQTVYKVGRLLRPYYDRQGIGSLFAGGTYAHAYRQGLWSENGHAPFFLFTGEDAAREFLEKARQRFTPAVRLALWQGEAPEVWDCPAHVYAGYKRSRWPPFWRAYARLRRGGPSSSLAAAEDYFDQAAHHWDGCEVARGTWLAPAFRLETCIATVGGTLGQVV